MSCLKKKVIGFISAFLLFISAFSMNLSAWEPVIYLNYEPNRQPYFILNDDGSCSGFEVQLAKSIFDDIDYRLDLTYRPYKTMPQALKENLVFFSTDLTGEIPGYKATADIYSRRYSFFSSEEVQIKNLSLEKLSDYRIGMRKAGYGSFKFENSEAEFVWFETPAEGLEALENGEIDLWFGEISNVDYLLKVGNLEDRIHFHVELVESVPVHMMVPEENEDLYKAINASIKELKASGEFEDIFQRFFLRHSEEYNQRQKNITAAKYAVSICLVLFATFVILFHFIRRRFVKRRFSRAVADSILNYGNRFVVLWKTDLSYYEVNDYFTEFFPVSNTVMPKNIKAIFGEDDFSPDTDNPEKYVSGKFDSEAIISTVPDKNGVVHEIIWTSIAIGKRAGVQTVLSIGSDVTEKNSLRRELQLAEERSRLAVESAGIALIFIDASGQITQLSDVGRTLLGIDRDTLLDYETLVGKLHPADRPAFTEIYRSCLEDEAYSGECEVRIFCRNDRYHWFVFKFKSIHNPVDGVRAIAGAFYDIDKDKNKDITIEKLAYVDELTGIYNRHKFLDSAAEAISDSKGTDNRYAIITLNLDKFHRFNDLHGVEAGDQILKAVANILKYNPYSEKKSICARLGSDEFAVLVELDESLEHLERYVMEISMKIRNFASWEYDDMKLTISAGGCIYPDNADDYIELYERSIYSMRIAKRDASIIYQAYNGSIREMIIQKEIWETELQAAVEKKQFELYYQPKIDMETEKIVGAEALIRWNHPERGIVSPSEFIPLAEEMGIIQDIGMWTLKTACLQNKKWQDMGYKPMKISVNISSAEFYQADIVDQIKSTLDETGLEPCWLEIELTESMALVDIDETVRKMRDLKKLGVGISMDDFGTGYSSLSHIKDLPIDELKLDKSFIDRIAEDMTTKNIISVIISLAKIIGLVVVAEGVEEREQFELLKKMKCNIVQGYLFSKPLRAENILELFEKN